MSSSRLSSDSRLDAPAPSSSRLRRESKRKALLIGINGSSSPAEGYNSLQGPHQDVAKMKNLLIGTYGYRDEDIQVLVDDGVRGHLQPIRHNIIISIENLVKDTQKGDKLFFHYCGHTIQVPNRRNTEEDGLDECIVPLDGEERMIQDNELRARLVDTLPVGASLVAVFDSCHSATLLDLEHLRCNRVFVPWLSRGKQTTDKLGSSMGGLPSFGHSSSTSPGPRLVISTESPSWSPTSRTVYQSARTSPTRIRSRRTSIGILCSPALSPRSSPRSPLSFRIAPWNSPVSDLGYEMSEAGAPKMSGHAAHRLSISQSYTSSRKSHIPAPLKLWNTDKENLRVDALATGSSQSSNIITPQLLSPLSTTATFCESPLAAYCQGWCRDPDGDMSLSGGKNAQEFADVISLGSCKDSELSWENEEGVGMTQALISVLEKDPHPTLSDLLTNISHTLHGFARERHRRAMRWKEYRRAQKIKSSGLGSFDTESFQHPQLASHKPLDLNTKWDI